MAPWPNSLFALDLTKPGAPLEWQFEPNPSPAAKGEACCDWVNRGAVFDGGRIFYNTLDGYTVAVDADTGKLVWRTHLADISKGETITMAPTVVHGKVLVGDSGGEFGLRGWLATLDTGSGKVVWQAYNTGPDKDVLIGDKFKPFYASAKGTDLGVKTWPPDAWRVGGGTVRLCCLRSIQQSHLLRRRKLRALERRRSPRRQQPMQKRSPLSCKLTSVCRSEVGVCASNTCVEGVEQVIRTLVWNSKPCIR